MNNILFIKSQHITVENTLITVLPITQADLQNNKQNSKMNQYAQKCNPRRTYSIYFTEKLYLIKSKMFSIRIRIYNNMRI